MKKLYQYTMILLAGVVGACSSLDVSDPYSENLPSDFSVATYMEIYPLLRKFQFKDYVKARNLVVEDSLKKLGISYSDVKTQDEANFKANIAALAEICKDRFMGGYPEASCANPAADATIMKDLMDFNFVNVPDDLAALRSFPVDEVAVSQQYIVFGRDHGWAYRWCETEADLLGPGRDPAIEAAQAAPVDDPDKFVADPGIYCAERGTKVLHKVN
jgi:hypothetical protein